MLWIGVTGSMGSGKSTVSAHLREMGYPVLDADALVREILRPGGGAEAEVLRTFGHGVCGGDGRLDRRALGRVVFSDPVQLEKLEFIVHPLVREAVARQRARLKEQGEPAAFYDVPLLFEKNMQEQFDLILVVSATPALRLKRLRARTGLSVAEIEERWSRQLPPQFKEARASAVIRNNADLTALHVEIQSALRQLSIPGPRSASVTSPG